MEMQRRRGTDAATERDRFHELALDRREALSGRMSYPQEDLSMQRMGSRNGGAEATPSFRSNELRLDGLMALAESKR